jgi:hypothetical protein
LLDGDEGDEQEGGEGDGEQQASNQDVIKRLEAIEHRIAALEGDQQDDEDEGEMEDDEEDDQA